MRRLTAKQVQELTDIVKGNLSWSWDELLKARYKKPVDPKEVAFYEERIQRDEALLKALPTRGGVSLEDDISDEQRDEDEDA